MLKRSKITSTLFVMWSLAANVLLAANDSLHVEILLTKKMLDHIHLDKKFNNTLEITPNRFILLSTSDQFYILGWGGIYPFGKKVNGRISSFAFTRDSLLMTIRDNDLCGLDSVGNIPRLIHLPSQEMEISPGESVMYVYDRNNDDEKKHALYVLARGGKYAKLLEVPEPIMSAVEMNKSILFATKNMLFDFSPETKELKTIAALQKDMIIESLAVDSSRNIIYFSTDSALFALYNSRIVAVTFKFAGVLRFHNDGLIVFNPDKKLLIRISGLGNWILSNMQSAEFASKQEKASDTLTNSAIIEMVKTKLSDDLIIDIISRARVKFDLSVDSMVFLSSQDVSSAVIMEMKKAMKKKAGNTQGEIAH